MSVRDPWPSQAPPARPIAGYTVMSWHWVGPEPLGGPMLSRAPNRLSSMPWMFWRRAALSAAVASPVPPRALTMLSSIGLTNWSGSGRSAPNSVAVKAPLALASSSALAAAAMSSGASPWRGGATRSLKMCGEETTAAGSGGATGTLMTSMRKYAELGSAAFRLQPERGRSQLGVFPHRGHQGAGGASGAGGGRLLAAHLQRPRGAAAPRRSAGRHRGGGQGAGGGQGQGCLHGHAVRGRAAAAGPIRQADARQHRQGPRRDG